ncbi:MAG: hypothetical protein ACE5FN_08145 [Leptospirillia bacterium]
MIPIYSVSDADIFPTTRLAQALLSRGRPSIVLDAERGLQSTPHPNPSAAPHHDSAVPPAEGGDGPALLDRILRQARAVKPRPEVCLLPLAGSDWSLASLFGSLLLTVPASRKGVREGYRLVKQVSASGVTGTIGIVVLNATDSDGAQRHFNKLAEGAFRFLGVDLVSYGYVPAPPPAYAPVDLLKPGFHDDELNSAVAGIAALIIEDLPVAEPTAKPPLEVSAKTSKSTKPRRGAAPR